MAAKTLYLEWNSDFVLMCRTSIETATGWDQNRQRIIRRIITSAAQQLPDGTFTPAQYIFDPTYGDGLGQMVGQNFNQAFLDQVEQIITRGVIADSSVPPGQTPTITFQQPNPQILVIFITVPQISGAPGQINLQLTK